MMKRLFLGLFLLTAVAFGSENQVFAQAAALSTEDLQKLRRYEDSLVATADSMISSPIPEDRLENTYRFVRQLKAALTVRNSFVYPFDSLGKYINIIGPEDNTFRIFNWSVSADANTLRYYGAIQMADADLKLYGLSDQSAAIQKGAMDSVLEGGRWFGALYYRIMPVTVAGKTAYTLFGLNAGNPMSNRKVLDLLWFSGNGPVFGGKVFGVRSPDTREQAVRFVMEYKKNVVAALNYNPEMDAIYFDRLESDANDPGRKYTYVPTGQYDGFRWQNGEWVFVQDLIPVTILQDGQNPVGGRD